MIHSCRPEPQAKDLHVLSPQVQILRSAQDDKRVLSPLVILRSAYFDCAQCRQDDNHGC